MGWNTDPLIAQEEHGVWWTQKYHLGWGGTQTLQWNIPKVYMKRKLLTGPSGKLITNVDHKCVRHVWRVNPYPNAKVRSLVIFVAK